MANAEHPSIENGKMRQIIAACMIAGCVMGLAAILSSACNMRVHFFIGFRLASGLDCSAPYESVELARSYSVFLGSLLAILLSLQLAGAAASYVTMRARFPIICRVFGYLASFSVVAVVVTQGFSHHATVDFYELASGCIFSSFVLLVSFAALPLSIPSSPARR